MPRQKAGRSRASRASRASGRSSRTASSSPWAWWLSPTTDCTKSSTPSGRGIQPAASAAATAGSSAWAAKSAAAKAARSSSGAQRPAGECRRDTRWPPVVNRGMSQGLLFALPPSYGTASQPARQNQAGYCCTHLGAAPGPASRLAVRCCRRPAPASGRAGAGTQRPGPAPAARPG